MSKFYFVCKFVNEHCDCWNSVEVMMKELLVVVCLCQVTRGIQVLSSDGEESLPSATGGAEILNSSLEYFEEFTICLRLNTFTFTVDTEVTRHQAVLVQGPFWLLSSFTALYCEHSFVGCTQMDKNFNPLWKLGQANGYHEDGQYFKAWQPQVWNAVCITASNNNLNITINEEQVLNQNNYKGNHRNTNGSNLFLMNESEQNPMHGMITDLQIWSNILTRQEISEWSNCKSSLVGDIINWDDIELNMTGLNYQQLDKVTVCPKKKTYEETFFGFDTRKTFDQTVTFCANLGGEMAVAVDIETLAAMSEAYNSTCTQGTGYFYGGYTDKEEEGTWVNGVTGDLINWSNWDEKHPYNYTNYDCVEISNGFDKFEAFDCSIEYCPVCKIRDMKTFQLRGVCLESEVDRYFAMVNTTHFRGYISSDLVFSLHRRRWEVVRKDNRSSVLGRSVSFVT